MPKRIILYGHVISDKNHVMTGRYKFPSFNEFREFIAYFKKTGYEFASYEGFLKNDVRKKILLTFDDGHRSIYTELHPYMLKENLPYMIFISTGLFEDSGASADFLNEKEVLELKSQGVGVGFHTRSHFKIGDETDPKGEDFIREVTIDKRYKDLFSEPLSFAYPFVAPKDYKKYDLMLYGLGYKVIFDTGGLRDNDGNHFFRLPMDIYDKNIRSKNCIFYNLSKALSDRYRPLRLLDKMISV